MFCQKSMLLLSALTIFLSESTVVSEMTTLLLKVTALREITTLFRNLCFLVRSPLTSCQKSTFSVRKSLFSCHKPLLSCQKSLVSCQKFLLSWSLFLVRSHYFPIGNHCSLPEPSLHRIFRAVRHALTWVDFLWLLHCWLFTPALLHLFKLSAGAPGPPLGIHSPLCPYWVITDKSFLSVDPFLISLIVSPTLPISQGYLIQINDSSAFQNCYFDWADISLPLIFCHCCPTWPV